MSVFSFNQNKLVKSRGFDLVLIIDRSGSMGGTEQNIIAGHQWLVNGLRRAGKNITLTTILFDDDMVFSCDGKRLDEIKKINYSCGGFTALYDAWGTAIIHENKRKKDKKNPYPNADVLYLTVTDGEENDSKIFDLPKIKDLMMKERLRSVEGHGVREFATIREFGLGSPEYENQLKIGRNNSQIFYRSDEGIAVLFKIIELAAENMLEYSRITDRWIKKSDRLKIGSYTLGQLKEMTKKPQRVLANIEKIYMDLILKADEGLTEKFWKAYHKFGSIIEKLKKVECMRTGDEEIDNILELYIHKHYTNEKFALQYAKEATVDKVAVKCAVRLGIIREICENKKSSANELFNAVNSFNESIRKLRNLPMYFIHLKTPQIADIISNEIFDLNKRYNVIITDAFKMRIELLKKAYGTENLYLFQCLSCFTQEPLFSLFKDFPVYKQFCGWYDTFNNELKQAS